MPEATTGAPRISCAIPVYDEQEVLPELIRRCRTVLDATPGGPHEIVIVDDGSRDATPEILARAAAEDARIVTLRLSRNFGHQVAITAALEHARGRIYHEVKRRPHYVLDRPPAAADPASRPDESGI